MQHGGFSFQRTLRDGACGSHELLRVFEMLSGARATWRPGPGQALGTQFPSSSVAGFKPRSQARARALQQHVVPTCLPDRPPSCFLNTVMEVLQRMGFLHRASCDMPPETCQLPTVICSHRW